MKFEMNRAWNDAVALLAQNRQVVAIVAGVFFFLPYMAFMLIQPDVGAAMTDPADAEKAYAQLGEFYARFWWAMILLMVLQGIGMLGILALLTDRRRPTVGEALRIGVGKILPYIGAYMLLGLAFAAIVITLVSLAALASPALGALAIVLFLPILFYSFVKFSLIPPVLVKEGISSPVAALRRSWQITKGNSFRLFGFYFLLAVVLIVIMLVLSMIASLVFAAFGHEAQVFGSALVASLINALWATGFLAVLSAVHDQLGGTSAAQIADTFE